MPTTIDARAAAEPLRYGEYTISENTYCGVYRYNFAHDSYNGPGDHRCGLGRSLEECREKIDEIEAEQRVCFCDLCHRDVAAVRNRIIGKQEDDRVKACEECYHRPLADFAF